MLSGLLICALLAGCAINPPTASTPPSSTLATATSTATATATPTPRPTTLYLAAGETVYALDLTTGAKRWTYATGLPAQSGGRNNWISAIAAISGGVYFDSVPDNSLYALKTSDGSLLWKASIPPTATKLYLRDPQGHHHGVTLPSAANECRRARPAIRQNPVDATAHWPQRAARRLGRHL